MSTSPVQQTHIDIRDIELCESTVQIHSINREPFNETHQSTIQPVARRECCDYIVPREKQPNCWQKLTPCQKTVICCGGIATIEGGVIGTLAATGVFSSIGISVTAGVLIGICCAIKLTVGGLWCYAKCCHKQN